MTEFDHSESFEPIDHIWELQNLKQREKNLYINLITLGIIMGINGGALLALVAKQGNVDSVVRLLELFIGETAITTGFAIYRDHTMKCIELVEDFFKNSGGIENKNTTSHISPTIDFGNEIIKA